MTEQNEELLQICNDAVEGLCPEGHFGLAKCPYPTPKTEIIA